MQSIAELNDLIFAKKQEICANFGWLSQLVFILCVVNFIRFKVNFCCIQSLTRNLKIIKNKLNKKTSGRFFSILLFIRIYHDYFLSLVDLKSFIVN